MEDIKTSQIHYAKHKNHKLLVEVENIINQNFPESSNFYADLELSEYRLLVKKTQDILNEKQIVRKIAINIKDDIQNYIEEDKFFIQTNLYLRASRPFIKNNSENIGWHRETFYGANMENSINLWTPIMNINSKNTLRYIPQSQKIPEEEIKISQTNDEFTKRYSDGHSLGFQYSPKIIVSGVNLEKNEPMNVPQYCTSIFPGNLIHGAAQNNHTKIRFSTDFRILPFRFHNSDLSKQFHFSSGKPYFEIF